jgi:predicted O-linked N-acetylglucosamine transferase (SPINDLY family)
MDPNWTSPHSNLLRDLQHLPDITGEELLEEHRNWFKAHGERLAREARVHDNDRDPERQLVVGWLSPDFRQHAVAYFFEPVLANYDRSKFRFIAYSELPHEDEFTARLKGYFDVWRPTFGILDEQVDRQIRADRVDILVDLAGHTSKNRAKLMCRAAAPVQAEFLGYPSTTGIEAIQWRITDAKADPVGMTERHYTEKLIRLPRTAWCYRPLGGAPDVSNLPADHNRHITFGSFNNFAKINVRVIRVWTQILPRVPSARLMLKYAGISEPSVRQALREQFAAGGVDPDRLDLRGRDPTELAHLAQYANIDIALDTFPYNGTTTTCEALWMGVPVVTIAGQLHQARVGASLLSSVGLDDWVAQDEEGYVTKAVEAAGDIAGLRELRSNLRQMMERSPLGDEAGFTRELEGALREIWRAWCRS